jgi:glucan phosphoethanolaminetransferase (alkaline phosphatase superfamily)
MNKKANTIGALILFIVIIVACAFVWILSYSVFGNIQPDILEDLSMNESKTIINEDIGTRYPHWADGAFAIVFAGIWIVGLASALTKDEHPLFFGVMMFVLLFLIIAGAILGNFYEEFFQDEEFTGLTANFPITNWILTHMLEVGIIVGLSILLTMYAKNRL